MNQEISAEIAKRDPFKTGVKVTTESNMRFADWVIRVHGYQAYKAYVMGN